MNVEINPVGGEVRITSIEDMIEKRLKTESLASFTVKPGDVLYIEPTTEKGSDVSAEPLDSQLSFDF